MRTNKKCKIDNPSISSLTGVSVPQDTSQVPFAMPNRTRADSWGSNMSLRSQDSQESQRKRKRGSNGKQSEPKASTSGQVPSQSNNIYTVLDMDVQESEVPSRNESRAPPRQARRFNLPAIVIHNLKITDVCQVIHEVIPDKTKSAVSLTSHGTKIFIDNVEDYKRFRDFLKANIDKINYISHPLPEEQSDKFVVYGLHANTRMEDIDEALKEIGVKAIQINNLNIKKPRYDGHATFQIQFKRVDKVTVGQLQQVRQIGYLRVRFAVYEGRREPCICPNCLRPSHGSSYCGMPPRCVKCGGNHASSSCPEREDKDDPKSRIPKEKVKCANCGGPHPATYRGCPNMREYVKIQNLSRKRNQVYHEPQNRQPPKQGIGYQHQKPSHNTVTHDIGSSHRGRKLYSEILSESPPGNDLLSMRKALELFRGLYHRLKKCQNREEQGAAILEFTNFVDG